MKPALKTILLAIFLYTIYQILLTTPALALRMANDNYIINMGNLNSIAGISSEGSGSSGRKLNITVGETAPGLFSGANYTLRSGFQYVHSIIPFAFSISSTEISFGSVDPTIPVTRSNFLTVSNGSSHGYQVTAQEDHPLLSPGTGHFIPNTTCDSGLCTETTADVWTSALTYGFGYNCQNVSGTDCASGFTDSTYYKQFAASPSATAVMSGVNVGRNRKVQITYKINVSQTQAAGTYTNVIQYIATPTF